MYEAVTRKSRTRPIGRLLAARLRDIWRPVKASGFVKISRPLEYRVLLHWPFLTCHKVRAYDQQEAGAQGLSISC